MDKTTKRQVISWAMYDWANSAFAVVVLAGFYPVFYKQYWAADVEVTTSTFHLGLANSVAGLVIVLLAPILGAIADATHTRKKMLISFALLGITTTAGLYTVGQGQWEWALGLFVLSVIGFMGSVIFSDSLIVVVCEPKRFDFYSSLAYALGYLGGGLLFAFAVATTVWPETFGFANAAEAVRFSFISTAVWWTVFSIPLLLYVKEGEKKQISAVKAVSAGFSQLAATFREIRKLKVVFLFLIAYWLYIDGVDTIVRMAVDYGLSIGLEANDLITALLITQFVGFPAAIVFGLLGQRIGSKRAILIAITVYFIVTVWAYHMETVREFYMLAIVIGLVQGGVQSLSRSMYARIIPPSRSAEFFGFYNMMGKFAAVLGPFMMGGITLLTESARLGILSVSVLFLAGGILLLFVNEEQGREIAQQLEAENKNEQT